MQYDYIVIGAGMCGLSYDFTGDDRTVDTHVKMLRESMGDYRKYIVTVCGTGY